MSKKQKQPKKAKQNNTNYQTGTLNINKMFNRITLIVLLGMFVLLSVSSAITLGLSTMVAKWMHVNEDNILVFGIIVMAMSIVFGLALSFAYSAVMIKASRPYLYALQRVADCDFSVRITDSSVFANFGIAQNFNNMAQQLQNVETLREGFINDFSHEFKTPIVSISGFAKLLKDPKLTAEQRNEFLDIIIAESDRLVGLSESVLMLNRLDTQEIVCEQFSLDEQLRQCALMFDKHCRDKNITLEADIEENIQINTNAKLLSQVWVNLLSNAVKFTDEGGCITVGCKTEGKNAVVTIADNGCGMSPDVVPNIFNKFYQGDNSHTTQGNGLGLSIVKKIVDVLDGAIYVRSELGKGSTFTVIFKV
ncbi:MAG: HAMP domain-containing histidine kinase [Clostridia bacterium]|nr:HAMP domain-containing histidine kinase [Clostridia bacterium]